MKNESERKRKKEKKPRQADRGGEKIKQTSSEK